MTKKHMITMAIIITLWFAYTVIMYGIFSALLSLAFGAGAILLWSKAASFFGRVDNFLKKQELPDEQGRAKDHVSTEGLLR